MDEGPQSRVIKIGKIPSREMKNRGVVINLDVGITRRSITSGGSRIFDEGGGG